MQDALSNLFFFLQFTCSVYLVEQWHAEHVSPTPGNPPSSQKVPYGRACIIYLALQWPVLPLRKIIFYSPNFCFLIYKLGYYQLPISTTNRGVANVENYMLRVIFSIMEDWKQAQMWYFLNIKKFHNNKSEFILLFNCGRNRKIHKFQLQYIFLYI